MVHLFLNYEKMAPEEIFFQVESLNGEFLVFNLAPFSSNVSKVSEYIRI